MSFGKTVTETTDIEIRHHGDNNETISSNFLLFKAKAVKRNHKLLPNIQAAALLRTISGLTYDSGSSASQYHNTCHPATPIVTLSPVVSPFKTSAQMCALLPPKPTPLILSTRTICTFFAKLYLTRRRNEQGLNKRSLETPSPRWIVFLFKYCFWF